MSHPGPGTQSPATDPVPAVDPAPAVDPVLTTDPAPAVDPAGATGQASAPAQAPVANHGYTPHKDAHLKRLRRIEGQIRGLQRMVDEDKYCIDVLTQVSAATRALQSFSLELLDEHLGHCVLHAAEHGGDEAERKVKEASEAIARLVRS